jgi:hypothetical protein
MVCACPSLLLSAGSWNVTMYTFSLEWLIVKKIGTQIKYRFNQDIEIVFDILFDIMKIAIIWDIAPCSSYMNWRFGWLYHLHLQDLKSTKQEISVRAAKPAAVTLVSCSADFRPWRWNWYVPPKRRFIYRIHGAISQKMAVFITTSVRTSNPTFLM